jgi:uncharacterized membrane protein
MDIIHEKGVVKEITKSIIENQDSSLYERQNIKVEILSGNDKGKIVEVQNDIYGNPYDMKIKSGDKVFLYSEVNDGVAQGYSIQDTWHSDGLFAWSLVFFILVIVIGGKSGLKALLSLGGSIVLIFFVLLPLIKNGYRPVPVTVAISFFIIFLTHILVTGVSKKSWVAMAGTLGGVLSAVVLAYLIGYFSSLNGLGTEDARTLAVNYPNFNFTGLLFSGIILGALGAVMDVAISIASGLGEVKEHNPKISRKKLFKSGMNIGKDIMGSMLNTLVFAYIGTAMISVVLFYLLETDLIELFNYGFIAEEVARSLVGSLGLVFTIPLTALLASFVMGKKEA